MNFYTFITTDVNDEENLSIAEISYLPEDGLNGSMSLSEEEDFMAWQNQYNEEIIKSNSSNTLIRPTDVLCGRGKVSFNHVGNKRFREIVTSSLEKYDRCESTAQRSQVVQSVIDSIHSIGGRFLKNDKEIWEELTTQQCRDKVGHAIRDATKNMDGRKRKGGDTSVASDDVVSQRDKLDVSERASSPQATNTFAKKQRSSTTSFVPRTGIRTGSLREDSKMLSITGTDSKRPSLRSLPFDSSSFGIHQYTPNMNSELFLPRRNDHSTSPHAAAMTLPNQSIVDVARNRLIDTTLDLSAYRAIDDIESHEELLSTISDIFGSGSLTSTSSGRAAIDNSQTTTNIRRMASSEVITPPAAAYQANFKDDQHYNINEYESDGDPLLTMINMTLGPPSSDDSPESNKIAAQNLEPIHEGQSSEEDLTQNSTSI